MLDRVVDTVVKRWVERMRKEVNIPVQLALWTGETYDLGAFEHPAVKLRANDASAIPALLDPTLDSLGEAYVQQRIEVDGRIADVIKVAYQLSASRSAESGLAARIARRFLHTREEDRESIQYHYDVSNEFYQLWLDSRMVYSCAYFETGDESLEEAQLKKIDHILDKIRLQPGHTLLDIGCGWGALVIRAAQRFGVRCVGITLSERQFALAQERVEREGLAGLVTIRLQDYRDVVGSFDRITSVGMFEHVGIDNLPAYFSRIRHLLAEDGVAMNHGITSTDADSGDTPAGGGTFIDKYVFPAGELPHISKALQAMQAGGLEALDVENLRRHYVRTLENWAAGYERHGERLREMIGELRYRIWRVYLAGCAHAFAVDNVSLYQIVCQKAGRSASTIPWSREYMYCGLPHECTERPR